MNNIEESKSKSIEIIKPKPKSKKSLIYKIFIFLLKTFVFILKITLWIAFCLAIFAIQLPFVIIWGLLTNSSPGWIIDYDRLAPNGRVTSFKNK